MRKTAMRRECRSSMVVIGLCAVSWLLFALVVSAHAEQGGALWKMVKHPNGMAALRTTLQFAVKDGACVGGPDGIECVSSAQVTGMFLKVQVVEDGILKTIMLPAIWTEERIGPCIDADPCIGHARRPTEVDIATRAWYSNLNGMNMPDAIRILFLDQVARDYPGWEEWPMRIVSADVSGPGGYFTTAPLNGHSGAGAFAVTTSSLNVTLCYGPACDE